MHLSLQEQVHTCHGWGTYDVDFPIRDYHLFRVCVFAPVSEKSSELLALHKNTESEKNTSVELESPTAHPILRFKYSNPSSLHFATEVQTPRSTKKSLYHDVSTALTTVVQGFQIRRKG